MNNLNDHQTQPLTCEHVIDFDNLNIVGFKLSKDSNYIAIVIHPQLDIEIFQVRIYQTSSFQLIITFNISNTDIKSELIFFSDDSSYLYYYSNFNQLNLLNLQDLTFTTILINIQTTQKDIYFFHSTLFIKEGQKLNIYNILNSQKIESIRFGFSFSHFKPFSSNQYYLMNDTKQTLEVWINYETYFKNKISKQFSKPPNKIEFFKNHLILCVFMNRNITFLSQNNFHILRNIMLNRYFSNQQLYLEDKISIITMQYRPTKIELTNLFPQISNSQLPLEQEFLQQIDFSLQTSKLIIGVNFWLSGNFKLKIYKLQF